MYSVETLICAPLSGKWAIWGQRNYGCCILAFGDEDVIIPKKYLKGMWRPASEALEDFMCLNFRNQQVPEKFVREFLLNYFNKKV